METLSSQLEEIVKESKFLNEDIPEDIDRSLSIINHSLDKAVENTINNLLENNNAVCF